MEKNYKFQKQIIVTYQYRLLWMFKRYATIIIKTNVCNPNQQFITASDEKIIIEIKRITGQTVTDILGLVCLDVKVNAKPPFNQKGT